eukprot:s2422_g10.t1
MKELAFRILLGLVLDTLGAPAFLVQLMKDIHSNTWMGIDKANFAVMRRGSRPGSPLADCVFNLLMSTMMPEFNQWVADQSDYQNILAEMGISTDNVIWADDIAVPWATKAASALPEAFTCVLQQLHRILSRRGFTINMAKGKTSVVVTFRGPQAVQMRERYEMGDRPGVLGRLALDRLLFAQKLWQHSPAFLQEIRMREADVSPDSWFCGLQHDIHWLGNMDSALYAILQQEMPHCPVALDMTRLIDLWQQDGAWWRKLVKRARRRHQQQEGMMTSARRLHRNILQVLKDHGAEFRGDAGLSVSDLTMHKCQCGHGFTTPQGLATHRRQMHAEYSMEHHLISGRTCASCLRIFWTRQRLQQHLSYMSRRTGCNACFQDLMRRGFDVSDVMDSTADAIPNALKGLHRKEKLQTFGAFPQGFDLHASKLDAARPHLQELSVEVETYRVPADAEAQAQSICASLSQISDEWFQRFVDSGFDAQLRDELADLWMGPIFAFEDQFDDWYAQILLDWGANGLQDLIGSLLDGEAEILIEEGHMLT